MGIIAMSAQAMTNIFENVNGIFGNSVGIELMTVVGQCIGAGRKEEAKYYIVKLMGIAGIGTLVSCLLVFAITKPVTWLAGMEIEAAQMCFELIAAMTVVKPLVWVGAFGLLKIFFEECIDILLHVHMRQTYVVYRKKRQKKLILLKKVFDKCIKVNIIGRKHRSAGEERSLWL